MLVTGIGPGRPPSVEAHVEPEEGVLAGLAVLRSERDTRSLLLVLVADFVATGALDVLAVYLAVAVLGLGPAGAGYLTAAFGAGGVLVAMAGLAIGSLLVPPLVRLGGGGAALAGIGVVIVLAVLAALPRLLALDRRGVARAQLMLLRSHELFAALPGPVLEGLATELSPVQVGAGATVINQGDVGDDFYLVARGRLRVSADGVRIATLGPASGFGEIALLQDVPRTASVIAERDCLLYALNREPFLDALRPSVRA